MVNTLVRTPLSDGTPTRHQRIKTRALNVQRLVRAPRCLGFCTPCRSTRTCSREGGHFCGVRRWAKGIHRRHGSHQVDCGRTSPSSIAVGGWITVLVGELKLAAFEVHGPDTGDHGEMRQHLGSRGAVRNGTQGHLAGENHLACFGIDTQGATTSLAPEVISLQQHSHRFQLPLFGDLADQGIEDDLRVFRGYILIKNDTLIIDGERQWTLDTPRLQFKTQRSSLLAGELTETLVCHF